VLEPPPSHSPPLASPIEPLAPASFNLPHQLREAASIAVDSEVVEVTGQLPLEHRVLVLNRVVAVTPAPLDGGLNRRLSRARRVLNARSSFLVESAAKTA